MREIKFRFWDKRYKRFSNMPFEYNVRVLCDGFESYEVMQYTGLKDCNGVEIYDGYIISAKETIDYNFKIIFKEGMFIGFNEKCEDFDTVYPQNFESFEVIGNIYENPELLLEK